MWKKVLVVLVLLCIPVIIFWRRDVHVEVLKVKYADPLSQYIPLEDMPVHYKIEGQGHPLLLLHGSASSLDTWDGWAQALKKNFRIIRLDLPGFGLTGPHPDGDYSMAFYAKFIKEFLDAFEIQHCYIAGNSLGGGIAWNFAATYPQYVDKLVLIDASGYPDPEAPLIFTLARIPGISNLLRYVTPEFVVRKNLEAVYYDDSKVNDQLVNRYYDLTLREGNRQAFIDRAQQGREDYNTYKLKNLAMPTLIMWGKHDKWIPEEDAFRFKSDIKNSEIAIYEDAGHIPMEEIPQKTAADVQRFLSEPDSIAGQSIAGH